MYPFNTQNATIGALKAHITCFSKAFYSIMATFTPYMTLCCRLAGQLSPQSKSNLRSSFSGPLRRAARLSGGPLDAL